MINIEAVITNKHTGEKTPVTLSIMEDKDEVKHNNVVEFNTFLKEACYTGLSDSPSRLYNFRMARSIYKHYKIWAHYNSVTPMSMTMFGKIAKTHRNIKTKRITDGIVYVNIHPAPFEELRVMLTKALKGFVEETGALTYLTITDIRNAMQHLPRWVDMNIYEFVDRCLDTGLLEIYPIRQNNLSYGFEAIISPDTRFDILL